MLSPLQNYFHYSRGERRGTVVLVIIIVFLLTFYFIKDFIFVEDSSDIDVSEFQEKIQAFKEEKQKDVANDSVEYFMFDPNEIGLAEWISLGFSKKQAESIENYKASGATFKIKKDVLKLFMVDEYKYAQLEPYIDLPDDYPSYEYSSDSYQEYEFEEKEVYAVLIVESEKPVYDGFEEYENVYYTKKNGVYQYLLMPYQATEDAQKEIDKTVKKDWEVIKLSSTKGYYPIANKTDEEKPEFKKISVDLNQADTTELKKLYGIGSGYAKRIVNYRESLGGFVSLNQLKEVYGLKKETIEKILPYIYLGEISLRKIDVNAATMDDLKAHPYIEWKVANSIVQIRNNYGKFASIDEITKSVLIDDTLYKKIKPYLEAK